MSVVRVPAALRNRLLDPLFVSRISLYRALAEAEPYAQGRLLDIGCGVKPYRDLFPRVEEHFGVELPGAAQGTEMADVYASGLALPFGNGSFDTVLATQVLEHVSEPKRLLGEAARVLRPGGHLIVTAPQVWGLHEEPHDYYRYTPHGLRYLTESVGLEVIAVQASTGLYSTLTQRLVSEWFHRSPGRGRVRRAAVRLSSGLALNLSLGVERLKGRHGDTLDNVLIARQEG